ncbi:transcription factor TGA1-like [Tripterygium wilfordii]|uniref:Transcription factor TGA1-like n=1 Tax=Tripterygium wilfordii TaxID=458696 RepID=A0A7J7DZN3_TRIWF|nr:transcription factor TGA1-like [Tripterygium wilfordii]
MSVLPVPDTTTRNNGSSAEAEAFHNFFESWLVEQNRYLEDLIYASKRYQDNSAPESTQDAELRPLVQRVVGHYEYYYRSKSRWAKSDVLVMLSPSWRSSLEEAFSWIGGWRPSMAFHLLYSKSGLQLEPKLGDLIRGMSSGDLGDLSASQMTQVNELQRKTIKEEKDITEKFAKHQETVADTSMVELSHVVSEMMMNDGDVSHELEEGRVESTLTPKEEGLEEILHKADDLRLRTLKGYVRYKLIINTHVGF